jgi:hypothetical protein
MQFEISEFHVFLIAFITCENLGFGIADLVYPEFMEPPVSRSSKQVAAKFANELEPMRHVVVSNRLMSFQLPSKSEPQIA